MSVLTDDAKVKCAGCGDLHEYNEDHPHVCDKCHHENVQEAGERLGEDR